jgi:Family of unknown function (DUF5946)
VIPGEQERDAYHQLCGYTLTHGDPAFIHQHVVDAFAAQTADEGGKPIAVTFALVGLYLHLERGFSGREVQRAHMRLGRQKHVWPVFELPRDRATMTAIDVLAAPAGPERDAAIDAWCASVWKAFAASRQTVVDLVGWHGIVPVAPRAR